MYSISDGRDAWRRRLAQDEYAQELRKFLLGEVVVDLCSLRARKSILSTGVLVLSLTFGLNGPAALAQDASAQGAAQGAAAAPKKNYKDRGEYDVYTKALATTDPKARLAVLQEWQDKYPQTDFDTERAQLFVATLGQLAGSDPNARQQLLDKAAQLQKSDPNNFVAAYYTVLYGPAVPNANADQITKSAHVVLDNADKSFSADKKPANMSADQWTQTKNSAIAIADNALAYEAIQNKDTAGAENFYKQSLQANPNDSRIAAALGKLYIDDKKYPDGLFEYARAANYDGPGALPEAQRKQLSDYFNKAYSDFHGSADGADKVIAQAKTSALPPDGFTIVSQNDIAQQQANALNQRIESDPAFKIWYAIQQNLQQKGDAFFNDDVKGFEIPGGEEGGPKTFTGTVISLDPAAAPTKVVLGVEDPTKPDATLEFSNPLPADALNVVKVGSQVQFSGIADSYTANPYMLTFKDPSIPGVKTATPAKTGRAHRKR